LRLFSCSALRKNSVFTLQKHCFLHANSMLLGRNINAITTFVIELKEKGHEQ